MNHPVSSTVMAARNSGPFAIPPKLGASLLAHRLPSALSNGYGDRRLCLISDFHRRHGGLRTRCAVVYSQLNPRIYPPSGGNLL